ncbi:MAG: cytochrome c oxidase assembly protein [Acidobacteria bacterium]|nr:cytochrome c oxidase assembly protein [Acidobacteriota bacterium]
MSGLPWRLHPVVLLVVVGLGVTQVVTATSHRQRRDALGAAVLLLVGTTWPLGDLAGTVSLTAATVQRLLIMIAWAPLWLRSLPPGLVARWTRPRLIDAIARRVAHPVVAVLVVTVVGTVSLMPLVVDVAARSPIVRALVVAVTAVLGILLWTPVVGIVPGARKLSALARAAYLFVSSLVVTSLSVVWIFARHPLYSGLHHQTLLGMSALLDQQVAGFVAKLGAYLPLWLSAFVIFSRADRAGDANETPLTWHDVERHFERTRDEHPRESSLPEG